MSRLTVIRLNVPADQSINLAAIGEASPEALVTDAVVAGDRGEGQKN